MIYIEYRGKDCMKKFCKLLEEQTMKIINFKKKKMSSRNQMKMQKSVIFVKKNLVMNERKIKNITK